MDKLAILSDVERRLARITTIDEAKGIRDQAEAIRVYAKAANMGLKTQNHAAEVKIRAEQRGGLLVRKMERAQGARDGRKGLYNTLKESLGTKTRAGAGMIAHRWDMMAEVPEAKVHALAEELTEAGQELSSAAVFRMGRKRRTPPPPSPVTTPGWADGPFRTLVIDPPWPVAKIVLDRRPVEREQLDYPTWELDRIRDEIPVERLADPGGCHVYLWVTHHFLPFGLECFGKWNVRYECVLTWIKPTAQPLWWTYNTEHVLFGKVGALAPQVKGQRVGFTAPQQRHSHKPNEFYDIVRAVSPENRYTIFDEARDGFTHYGVQHVSR